MVALGLQRSQEASFIADPLGAARATAGWVKEAQGHHPSGTGRAASGVQRSVGYRVGRTRSGPQAEFCVRVRVCQAGGGVLTLSTDSFFIYSFSYS